MLHESLRKAGRKNSKQCILYTRSRSRQLFNRHLCLLANSQKHRTMHADQVTDRPYGLIWGFSLAEKLDS